VHTHSKQTKAATLMRAANVTQFYLPSCNRRLLYSTAYNWQLE